MNRIRLKTRYVVTVLAVGLLLTAAVVAAIQLGVTVEQRIELVAGIGIALSLLAAWLTFLLVNRVDRGMTALMNSAERIGRGHYTEPVPASGVGEMAALESSLERMRQQLAGTAISRVLENDRLSAT
mgnify:CR=1 FL=1